MIFASFLFLNFLLYQSMVVSIFLRVEDIFQRYDVLVVNENNIVNLLNRVGQFVFGSRFVILEKFVEIDDRFCFLLFVFLGLV